MKIPLISIITPTFNAAATIEKALKSVACQHFKGIEHLIIDGNSEDNTIAIVHSYQKKYGHIRLICEKDEGIYNAINKGIDFSYGNWLYFLGADDELYNENVLSDLFDDGIFKKNQVVYGNVLINGDAPWASNGTIYDGQFDLAKLLRKNICHQSMFYPRSIIKENGYFTKKYNITADWDYNLRCFAKKEFYFINKTIAIFNAGGKSTTDQDFQLGKDFPSLVVKYFNLDPNNIALFDKQSPFYEILTRYNINPELILEDSESLNNNIFGIENYSKYDLLDLLAQNETIINDLEISLKNKDDQLSVSQSQIKELNFINYNVTQQLIQKENLIKIKEAKMQEIYSSYTWKIGKLILLPVTIVYNYLLKPASRLF